MATRNTQQWFSKAEQEEQALLECVKSNDAKGAAELLHRTGPLPRMQTALEHACRYCGPEMAELLLDEGAYFSPYRTGPSTEKEAYGEATLEDPSTPYGCLLRAGKGTQYEKSDMEYTRTTEDEYRKTISLLVKCGASVGFDSSELLLLAVLADDEQAVRALEAAGVSRLSGYVKYVMADGVMSVRRNTETYSARFVQAFDSAGARTEEMCARVADIVGGKVRMRADDITDRTFRGEYAPLRAYCAARHTTLAHTYGKKRFLQLCIEEGFEDALDWALKNRWAMSWTLYQELNEFARECGASETTLACLLRYKDLCSSSKAKAEARARNTNPFSAQALRAMWSTKPLEDGTLEIMSYKGGAPDGLVEIPAQIGKKKVTQIAYRALGTDYAANSRIRDARRAIRSVRIPETIKEVPKYLLSHSVNLVRVELCEGVSVIGQGAFRNCPQLKEAIFPSTLTRIEDEAFSSCPQLQTTIDLLEGVSIEGSAFCGCSALTNESGIVLVGGTAVGARKEVLGTAYAVPPAIRVPRDSLWKLPVMTYRPKTDEVAAPMTGLDALGAGDEAVFGRFPQTADLDPEPLKWICVDRTPDKALLVSVEVIAGLPEEWVQEVNWAAHPLRQWLNGTFLKYAFNASERNRISPEKGLGCTDNVFVLSKAEADRYFPTDESRKCKFSEYAAAQMYTVGRPAWMLRTDFFLPRSYEISFVDGAGCFRGRAQYGWHIWEKDAPKERITGIRPALWVRLS